MLLEVPCCTYDSFFVSVNLREKKLRGSIELVIGENGCRTTLIDVSAASDNINNLESIVVKTSCVPLHRFILHCSNAFEVSSDQTSDCVITFLFFLSENYTRSIGL